MSLPKSFKKLSSSKFSAKFWDAVSVITTEMCYPKENEVCIRNKYVGICADDVNMTKGRLMENMKVPFDVGFEGIGEIVAVGDKVDDFKVGDTVVCFTPGYNCYAEYVCCPISRVYNVPDVKPEYLAVAVSALAPCIGLDKVGRISKNQLVLVTAAAGSVGNIAVQWAKLAGCRVVGVCGSDEKAKAIKTIGCERAINYKKEDLDQVLSREYPNGFDVIWETVGSKIFEVCLRHIATRGRLLVVGGTSGYKRETEAALLEVDLTGIPQMLFFNSKCLMGYNMENHSEYYTSYYYTLLDCVISGKIRPLMDVNFGGKEFFGMEGIIRAVEYIHSGKSIGKVVVKLY